MIRSNTFFTYGVLHSPPPPLNLSRKSLSKSRRVHIYSGLSKQIHRAPLSRHGKQLAAIIVALGFLICAWFTFSTPHTSAPNYPYYDTQKPVPPWSEPTPLEGNRDRAGAHR
jgi:hypothetical protein